MKKQTQLTMSLLALVAVVALFAGLYLSSRPQPVPGEKSVTVSVLHSNGKEKTFRFQTDHIYLGDLLLAEGLVKGETGPYGLYIKEVDAETADFAADGAYWALFEAEEYAMQGADVTVLEDGDTFSLVYTLG